MPDGIREIECLATVRLLWDYLDSELDETRMREVEHHLAACQACLPHAVFGQRLLDALHAIRDRHAMPPTVRAEVVAALRAAGYSRGP